MVSMERGDPTLYGTKQLYFGVSISSSQGYHLPLSGRRITKKGSGRLGLGAASKPNRRLTGGSARLLAVSLFRTIETGRNRRSTGGWVLKPSLNTRPPKGRGVLTHKILII